MGFVVLALFTGILPVVFLYLIAWAVMPIGPKTYVQFSSKQLYRSIRDRKIAGICGGIAEMLGISATICRILFGALLLLTGIVPLTIAYLIGIGVIPEKPRFP